MDDFERSFMNMAFGDQVSVLLTVSLRITNLVMMYTNSAKKQDQDATCSLGSKAQVTRYGCQPSGLRGLSQDGRLAFAKLLIALVAKKKRKLDEVSSWLGWVGLSPFGEPCHL